jgi:hypothetical protein
MVNRNAFVPGVNSATLSGAGLGLNWTGPHQVGVRLYVATPFGPTPALVSTTAKARGWAELDWAF